MRLKLTISKDFKHSDVTSCVGWASPCELYSIGDDHMIMKWNLKTSETTEVAKLPKDIYCTDIHWFPANTGKKQVTQSELFALACTDGRFLLVSKSGRVEKTVEGHKGAVLGVKWIHDGTAILTYGEDGAVKIWSRAGMLRSVLAQNAIPVYAASWSPDSNQVLYASGKSLIIKPLQPSTKPSQWKAHDGIILAVDWNITGGLIISGGEDRKYKVWDCYGRALYTSLLHDSPVTSVAWAPDGELFAVGGFNTLRLCDKAGWSHSLDKPQCGTIFKLAWSNDGTQVGGASGSGQIVIGQVLGRRIEWKHLEAIVTDDNSITVRNAINDSKEYLVLNERIIKISLDWDHLIVTTPTQCFIYRERNWTTPVIFDLKSGAISLIKQAERFFMLVESFTGVQIISYEGRTVCTIKHPALQPDTLNSQTVAVSNDTIAIRDKRDLKSICFFDALSGRELSDPLHHKLEVDQLDLSRSGTQRLLAFTDKNHDLFVIQARERTAETTPTAIGSIVTSLTWNDQYNILVGMQDTRLMAWYHPAIVFTDQDLLPLTTVEVKSGYSKNPQIVTFLGSHVTLRRSDGAIIMARLSPFPAVLHQHFLAHQWTNTVKLCRVAKDPALWACLAGMATGARELSTAITAYSAIDEIDKVRYLTDIQSLHNTEVRNAELALFCHQPHTAEAIYIQSGLVFRAIEINIQLFQWERALELAVRYKTHVDTVLAYRQKYLEELGCEEIIKKFQQYNEKITIDWEKIQTKVTAEHAKIQ